VKPVSKMYNFDSKAKWIYTDWNTSVYRRLQRFPKSPGHASL